MKSEPLDRCFALIKARQPLVAFPNNYPTAQGQAQNSCQLEICEPSLIYPTDKL